MTGLEVGVIGAGRVGAVLGAALARSGHRIVAASGVSRESVDRAARLLPGVPLLPPDEVARGSELLLLAVPDDTLEGLVNGLVEVGAVHAGQILVHTSGAHGRAAMAPAAELGATTLALHPAMTLTGGPDDLDRLAGVRYGVTAADDDRELAERLVADLGGVPVWIAETARPLYHAALASGANHLVTLVAETADLLRAAGVADTEGVLRPLLRAALDNALVDGDAALTGPVVRGDAGTVRRHLAELGSHAPQSVSAYVALARRTADRAIASGRLRPRDAGPVLDALTKVVAT